MSTPLPQSPRFWPVYFGLAILRLCSRLPWSWLRCIGSLLGMVIYVASAERRRITHINLDLCFPELNKAERRKIARRCFREGGQAILELAAIWFGDKTRVHQAATLTGLEHIEQVRAQGRGVLLIGFHTNDLELGATSISDRIQNLAGMYRPHSNVVFNHAMFNGRTRYFPLIDRGDSRGAVRWLKNGNVLWYAPDQDYGAAQSVFAPFFHHPAATINATTRLAKMSNALVIPMTHFRTPNGIEVQLHSPLDIPGESDFADALLINSFLTTYLRQHPSNYMWMHRRFKTQPEGHESLYPERTTNEKRLSVRRYKHYQKIGVSLPTRVGADACLQLSANRLILIYRRPWWQTQRREVKALKKQLLNWQQQGISCAQWLKHNRCSAESVDVIHLHLPMGELLANSTLSKDDQMALIGSWCDKNAQSNKTPSDFWLSEHNQLTLLP